MHLLTGEDNGGLQRVQSTCEYRPNEGEALMQVDHIQRKTLPNSHQRPKEIKAPGYHLDTEAC